MSVKVFPKSRTYPRRSKSWVTDRMHPYTQYGNLSVEGGISVRTQTKRGLYVKSMSEAHHGNVSFGKLLPRQHKGPLFR